MSAVSPVQILGDVSLLSPVIFADGPTVPDGPLSPARSCYHVSNSFCMSQAM